MLTLFIRQRALREDDIHDDNRCSGCQFTIDNNHNSGNNRSRPMISSEPRPMWKSSTDVYQKMKTKTCGFLARPCAIMG
jgi:hypothetical protein